MVDVMAYGNRKTALMTDVSNQIIECANEIKTDIDFVHEYKKHLIAENMSWFMHKASKYNEVMNSLSNYHVDVMELREVVEDGEGYKETMRVLKIVHHSLVFYKDAQLTLLIWPVEAAQLILEAEAKRLGKEYTESIP